MFFKKRWNPDGQVRLDLLSRWGSPTIRAALLCHRRLDRPWSRARRVAHQTRRKRVDRCARPRTSRQGAATAGGTGFWVVRTRNADVAHPRKIAKRPTKSCGRIPSLSMIWPTAKLLWMPRVNHTTADLRMPRFFVQGVHSPGFSSTKTRHP